MPGYRFSVDWFSGNQPMWTRILDEVKPSRFLEIGSFEGRSACFLVEHAASQRAIELHCIDPWRGRIKGDPDLGDLEARFDHNISMAIAAAAHPVSLHKHKGLSSHVIPELLAAGRRESFDFIYVDGSHKATDVLLDAVMGFELLAVGGAIVFDDYLWHVEAAGAQDHYNMPKPAIDAFVNIYRRKLEIYKAPLYQLYARKLSA
jgi:predicted O-methyltransferase YrrM